MTTTATTPLTAATASLEAYADEIPAEERARIAALATKDATDDVEIVLAEQGLEVVRSTLRPGTLGWSEGAATAGSAETHGLDGARRLAYYAAYDAAGLAEARRVVDAADAAPVGARAANVRPSICAGRAWDVDVTLVDTDGSVVAEGEVTLVVGEYDGRPSSWGCLDHWASSGLAVALYGHRDLVGTVEHVAREAIEASDVPRSAEYEG